MKTDLSHQVSLVSQFIRESGQVNVTSCILHLSSKAVVALLSVCPVLADFAFVMSISLLFTIVTAVYCCIPFVFLVGGGGGASHSSA